MSNDQFLLLAGVGVLSIGAMCVGLTAAWYSGRRYAEAAPAGDRPSRVAPDAAEVSPTSDQDEDLTAPRRHVRDRALRIVALLFLASVAALVAITGDWPDTEVAIYLLIAAGTLAVAFLGDLMPTSIPGGVRSWIEAGAALGFLIVLTGLSDGLDSPFFVGFFLVVGAASLSRDGMAPVAMALIAGLGYGVVGLLVASDTPVLGDVLGQIGFEIVMLLLLAFIGTVAGREQRRAREAALRLARFDPLTGLYNRSHFFSSMERELRLAERAGRGFSLLMLDLDGLKPVNDTFGHHYGDRLLQAITEVIQRNVRVTDTPARYGGDEFVILLPDTDAAGGFVVAEKLRRDISGLSIRVSDRSIHTSVSIGLVAYPEDGTTADALMAGADAALYEAKRSGKDRIVGYTTRTERVATRMGSQVPDSSADEASRVPSPEAGPTATGRAPDTNRRATQPASHAPWETGTGVPVAARRSTRVVTPAGTSEPPVPRQRVALPVQDDAGTASPGAAPPAATERRGPT